MSKNKYLYISDLDGTLLNSHKQISEFTRQTLNSLIDKGVHFSVATARTVASSVKILSGLQLNVPVILMNGVAIYDVLDHKYIKIETISPEIAYGILDILKKHNITGFLYSIANEKLNIYYESLATAALQEYHDEHAIKYEKKFEHIASFANVIRKGEVIYFTLMGEQECLVELLADLNKLPEIDAMLSSDVYIKNLWYLEIHSTNASKYNAAKYLSEYCGFDKIIGFGDNFNDVPLYKACDEFFAVANAVDELKVMATGIIGDNNSDAVSKFIATRENPLRLCK